MNTASARRWWFRGLLAAAVLVAAIVLPAYWTRHVLTRDYLDHLFILQHDYVYEVGLNTGASNISFIVVKNADNQFDIWEPGVAVNRAVTAAFMLDSSGLSITSRYATEPWNNSADVSAIKRLISAEAGVAEDSVRVSGTTVKLTLQSAAQSAQGNAFQMNYVVYDEHEDGKEVRYVRRAENGPPVPVSDIDVGDTYLNNLEKGKPLYALAYINFVPGFPFALQVIDLSIENYDSMASSTMFEESASSIPEGAPVFDKSHNLVGVFTSASSGGQANYISNLLRHQSRPSGALKATLDAVRQNTVDSVPPAIPDVPVLGIPAGVETKYTPLSDSKPDGVPAPAPYTALGQDVEHVVPNDTEAVIFRPDWREGLTPEQIRLYAEGLVRSGLDDLGLCKPGYTCHASIRYRVEEANRSDVPHAMWLHVTFTTRAGNNELYWYIEGGQTRTWRMTDSGWRYDGVVEDLPEPARLTQWKLMACSYIG